MAISQKGCLVVHVGISMGGLLGLKLAQELGNSLKGLALLGVPWKLRPIFSCLVIPSVRYTPLRFVIESTAKNFEKSVLDPKGRELYRENSLARMPSKAVFQMEDLAREVKKGLKKVSQPLLLIHGLRDHLADPKGMLDIKKRVSSKQVDVCMMEHSAHVFTLDYDHQEVAKKVLNFFESL